MAYRLKAIELYVRETEPARMLFSLGKDAAQGADAEGTISPLGHVRVVLADSHRREAYGCAADRLSVRWLDKRPGQSHDRKRRELVQLIEQSRGIALEAGGFEHPFEFWSRYYPQVMRASEASGQEQLTGGFAAALLERAVIDAVCRLEGWSFFQAVKGGRLGFKPSSIHPGLDDSAFLRQLPAEPRTQFWIRHTVGAADPLVAADIAPQQRIGDGLPESLEEYIAEDGVRFFKIKITGDVDRDLARLERIWRVVLRAEAPVVTLDANEAYTDLVVFERFLQRFEHELLGLFQHVAYIEQPLPRDLTLDHQTADVVRRLAERKPLLIDEADGSLDAFARALDIGYRGVSHKNCKGVFKSLANAALCSRVPGAFLSAEDLQNLPIVPLHQDFTTLGVLGVEHCERNGHHYNFGLSMLSEPEKEAVRRLHPDLYVSRGDELFLKVVEGQVECGSLQVPGFGIASEPEWSAMWPMAEWLQTRHPDPAS